MCGISFALQTEPYDQVDTSASQLLRKRGPDCSVRYRFSAALNAATCYITVFCSVLSLRGSSVTSQPLLDDATNSLLCWNGEAYSIDNEIIRGSDSRAVLQLLLTASISDSILPEERAGQPRLSAVIKTLSHIAGPYAFVYFDAISQRLWFGRDVLGRRSLLIRDDLADGVAISSVVGGDDPEKWSEVEADGVYVADLSVKDGARPMFQIKHVPYVYSGDAAVGEPVLISPLPRLNRCLSRKDMRPLRVTSLPIDELERLLRKSLEIRLECISRCDVATHDECSKVAILFSGGVDCTLLARIAHDIIPLERSVDLLNVAFHNPRVHGEVGPKSKEEDTSVYERCPDRITGRKSLDELRRVCVGRAWRFVEINVPYEETQAHRSTVLQLMHPHRTEMDLSIANALYFASRGEGMVQEGGCGGEREAYRTCARVLLSGLGADEVFGGYQRHATAYSRAGLDGLLDELQLDVDRLGKRNLGRDDRVTGHWGREVRYPYLDEVFLAWALAAPVWEKMGFGEEALSPVVGSDERDDGKDVEPGKKALRLLAMRLGMRGAGVEKKRAIQFGARTAKMESGRTTGTRVIV